MKLKQQPEDFLVEELTDASPGDRGAFAFFRLDKTNWTTHDALDVIRRRWKLETRRLSHGGLKDRHAHTIQYLSIFHGPRRRMTHQGIALEYLGQIEHPYTSQDIRGNQFRITLRDLSTTDRQTALDSLEEVRAEGIPNYFDDQRFGSVGADGNFVAKALVLGNYEEALRLALAEPYEFDRGPQKKEKAILRAHWGNWVSCKEKLPRCHARSLVDYLVHHPTDFRGAVERLRPDLRGLYLSAYQSFLWNRMLALFLSREMPADQLIRVRMRREIVPMHRGLGSELQTQLSQLQLPLPNHRVPSEPPNLASILLKTVLDEEGLEAGQLKLKGIKEMFFSRGDRSALCIPRGISHETGQDELNPGKEKLFLSFELPRGSYATLVVKRITAMANI